MFFRAVIVTIVPGQTDTYWRWAQEIVALWDEHGIRRCGGPFRTRDDRGNDMGIWLTAHDTEADIQGEFHSMYSEARGRELIEQRPPLVADTRVRTYAPWELGDAVPEWVEVLAPPEE